MTVASVTEVTATEANSIHPLYQVYSGTALVGGPDSVVKFKAQYLRDTGATLCVLRAGVVPASHQTKALPDNFLFCITILKRKRVILLK